MADFPKAANGIIAETGGGAFYHAKFDWVPRVGELIDLTSFLDIVQKSKEGSRHYFEVVAVIHAMHDVYEGDSRPHNSLHSLTVIVKKSSSPHFNG